MGIRLSKVRIKDFRSIEYAEIDLNDVNILIGQNNNGKSNFLRAINIALNINTPVSEEDIYVSNGETLSRTKSSIIDVMIRPTDDEQSLTKDFSDFWVGVFTDKWITTDVTSGAYVGIRTVIEYDLKFDQYTTQKRSITQWNSTIEDSVCGRKQSFTSDMVSFITCFYMDAHRDILEDLKNKRSFLNRATSNRDLPVEIVRDIEAELSQINKKLVDNTPALNNTQKMISEVGNLFGIQSSVLEIEPISRSISDLHRGMDLKYCEGSGPSLSIAEQGMGTRSWISFLTLGAYISYLSKSIKAEDDDEELFVVLALEEPEAHLHSYAQKRLFNQITKFPGQKIITTHSANIVAQAELKDLLHLYKKEGKTHVHRIDFKTYEIEELAKIKREVIRSKGDLLFSTAIILAEGITEELALPIYFQEFFGEDPNSLGIAIIGIDGQNYKSFLHLAKDFDIPWFIISDGEEQAKKAVKNAIKDIFNVDYSTLPNVIVLDDGDDYEDYLIRDGYLQLMIDAVNKYEAAVRKEIDPEGAKHDPRPFLDRFIEKENSRGKQYQGEEGRKKALLYRLQNRDGKAKYAYVVADEIVNNTAGVKKIPTKIQELFKIILQRLYGKESLNEDQLISETAENC